MVLTPNGVVYDLINNDFIIRNHSAGYAVVYIPVPNMKYAYQMGITSRTMRLSNLMYTTFHGPIKENYQVDHIDNNRYNDHAENLQLLTAVENTRKSREEGARNSGFTIEMNETFAKMLSEKKTNADIAAALGFGYETRQEKHRIASLVNKLRTQKGYFEDLRKKYNLGDYDQNNSYPFTRLGPEMYDQIRAEAAAGMKGIELAHKYNVSAAAISRILNYKTKTDLKNKLY